MNFSKKFIRLILLVLLLLLAVFGFWLMGLIPLSVDVLSQSLPSTSLKEANMITQKIVNLSNAMAEFEGWYPPFKSGIVKGKPSVSYRNHNPGNLRSSIFALGVRDGFAYFYNDDIGMFALYFDIMRKAQGKTVTKLNGESTIAELIKVYSTSYGSTLKNYVKFVSSRTGLSSKTKLKTLLD